MAFTYNGDLATSLDLVRFHINDTVEDTGPKANGGNFTDAELSGLITAEGDAYGAVAAVFEVLAADFASLVDFALGNRKESLSQTSKSYAKQAEMWRGQHGSSGSTSGTLAPTRTDGYSDDIPAGEV